MSNLKIGTRLDMGLPTYEELSGHAKLAEKLGYDAVWVRDHVSLEAVTGQAECFEVWTIMAALARDTSKVKIGSLVLCTPFRNPALLAKMATTLDLISNGRLYLGIGAGHKESEFQEYGYEFPSPGARLGMLSEAIQIIRLMWTERRPSFEGKYYQIKNALNEPKPIQQPMPSIMVGASGPRAMRVVARYADAWNAPDTDWDFYTNRRQLLADLCEEYGRPRDAVRHVVTIPVIVDRSESAAQARLEKVLRDRPGQQYLRDRIKTGTPEQIAEAFKPYLDLGVREFITSFWELDRQAEGIETFGSDVRPLLDQMVLATA